MSEKSLVEKASEFLSANVGDKMTINLEQLCQAVVDAADIMNEIDSQDCLSCGALMEIDPWIIKYCMRVKRD